jgi:hypothetical protein
MITDDSSTLTLPPPGELTGPVRGLEVTMADLVLGTSNRERLFEMTRELPEKAVEELLSRPRQLAAKTEE